MGSSSNDDFSVFVLASDLGVDATPFLSTQEQTERQEPEEAENWHECSQYLVSDEDFSDLDLLQFFRLEGSDKSGSRICRVVGKYFPGDHFLSILRFFSFYFFSNMITFSFQIFG